VQGVERRRKKGNTAKPVEILNATYADLPAPRWDWEEMPAAPVPRLDGASVQIGDLLYVAAGYESLDHVSTLNSLTHFVHNFFSHLFFLRVNVIISLLTYLIECYT
jgi:hypothetical protein